MMVSKYFMKHFNKGLGNIPLIKLLFALIKNSIEDNEKRYIKMNLN